ncbi:VOC family protein [Altererythrobacter sp. CC-YST694]|uniref:VOC family protein n=1 Tax=Altererythrobacter sp. CC-YST694 TaxID=2755038 RepID=UPI001D004EFA|nr:VOC family protein [Altererythrobacter sp. CC-YST694]MCB5424538.1 VOC family protein [Altererythrobacter sp. CC-YST694]
MLDHIGLAVTDIARARRFYDQALKALGYSLIFETPSQVTHSGGTWLGYGPNGKPVFWVGDNVAPGQGYHVAFRAESRAKVRDFHAAALAAGGTDNGAPGLRPDYADNYYAAFVLDPDGINLEAVCYAPE